MLMFVFGMFGMFETFGTFWSLKDFFVSFTFFFFIRFFYHLLHFGERFSGDNSSYRKTVVVGTAGTTFFRVGDDGTWHFQFQHSFFVSFF